MKSCRQLGFSPPGRHKCSSECIHLDMYVQCSTVSNLATIDIPAHPRSWHGCAARCMAWARMCLRDVEMMKAATCADAHLSECTFQCQGPTDIHRASCIHPASVTLIRVLRQTYVRAQLWAGDLGLFIHTGIQVVVVHTSTLLAASLLDIVAVTRQYFACT